MNPLRSVGPRLALGVFVAVAGALVIVYLILVPSLERRLVNAKLKQLERASLSVARQVTGDDPATLQFRVEDEAKALNTRIVVFDVSRTSSRPRLRPIADSGEVTSVDIGQDRIALEAARAVGPRSGTVRREGERFAERAVPLGPGGANVVLLSASLAGSLETVELVERRLLVGGLVALMAALLLGYGAAWAFARRIRRLERAADRIAGGRFDVPVTDRGSDELAELASAFDRMRQRLAQLDRARNEFIANASHELRTPLFSLSGFLELLTEEDLDEETRREFLDTMREQTARLTRLATDLLDLSRLDAGRIAVDRRAVDLGAVARSIAREFRAIARTEGRALEVEGDGAVACADEERVGQIARILLENALVHTPSGTAVRIRTRVGDDEAVLEVEDEGPGIPVEHRSHLFERFYRVDGAVASGSGLGLAIARELAELMGGSLELQTEAEKTVFMLRLRAQEAVPPTFSRENQLVH